MKIFKHLILFVYLTHFITPSTYSYSKSSFQLQTGGTYSDNMYLTPSDKTDEITISTAPSLSYERRNNKYSGRLNLTPTYSYNLFDTKSKEENGTSLNGAAEIGNISISGNLGVTANISRNFLLDLTNSSTYIPNATSVSSSALSKGTTSSFVSQESLVDTITNTTSLSSNYLISRKKNSSLQSNYSYTMLRFNMDNNELENLFNNSESHNFGLSWVSDIVRNHFTIGVGTGVSLNHVDMPTEFSSLTYSSTMSLFMTNNFINIYKFGLIINYGLVTSHSGEEYFSLEENNLNYSIGSSLSRAFFRDRITSALSYSRGVSQNALLGTLQLIQTFNLTTTFKFFRYKGIYLLNPNITGSYNLPDDGVATNTWTISTNLGFPITRKQGIYFNYVHMLQNSEDSNLYPEFSQNLFSVGYFMKFD